MQPVAHLVALCPYPYRAVGKKLGRPPLSAGAICYSYPNSAVQTDYGIRVARTYPVPLERLGRPVPRAHHGIPLRGTDPDRQDPVKVPDLGEARCVLKSGAEAGPISQQERAAVRTAALEDFPAARIEWAVGATSRRGRSHAAKDDSLPGRGYNDIEA